MKRAILMMAGLIAVTGCASAQPHLNRGTVIDKVYTRAYWEPIGKCEKYAAGKPKNNNNCISWKWHNDFHDECYGLIIEAKGKEEEVCVSHTVYQNYRVGDTWHER